MMTMMLITGRNEEGFVEAEGTSQSLLQGQGGFHEGQPCVSMASLQEAIYRLPSLTGTCGISYLR